MLVLGRRVGESVVISDNIRITVTKVAGNKVRIGIDAPDDVAIRRAELPRRRASSSQHQYPAHIQGAGI